MLTLTATSLFAIGAPYVKLLTPLSGLDILAWRILLTLPFVLIAVALQRGLGTLRALIVDCRVHPQRGVALVLCAGLFGIQQWLFLWASLHGRVHDVSLGYFVLPIVMVLVGWLVDGHRVHPLQWLAVAFASVGIAHEWLAGAGLSWPLLVVALGFPPYFLMRRRLPHDSVTVLAAEIAVLIPIALISGLGSTTFFAATQHPALLYLLPGFGALSAFSFAVYLQGSRMLPMGLFGLLGYTEPILLVLFSAFVFHEHFAAGALWTYLPIALSIVATGLYVVRVR